ncbi:MAG: DNA repair protein RecO [Desulfatitalea sp.]|nr:DNA repair protein RecO [Desulfatitalea sp.]NNK02719.1 DNA repair protein RecO [Desulfatitalea sp.]
MNPCTTPAIVLRRRDYADFDLILTVLTQDHGVRTLIAKSAKKSVKRFPGILEPFAGLKIVFRPGRGKGLPVLTEADLVKSHTALRSDIQKTAYASYWSELVAIWLEEGQSQARIFELLDFVLDGLSDGTAPDALLSLLFQMRFVGYEGLRPILERCACCRKTIEAMPQHQFCIDLSRGGIVCHQCPMPCDVHLKLGKGTLKQLLWMAHGDLSTALRVRFGPSTLAEASQFLEAFVPYHIGRMPKSLDFLRRVRKSAA